MVLVSFKILYRIWYKKMDVILVQCPFKPNFPQLCVFITDIQGRSQNLHHFHPLHGAPIGGLRIFPIMKPWFVMCLCHLHLLQSKSDDKHALRAAWHIKIVGAKTWTPPIWVPLLTTPLHRAVYKVWNLPCVSVVFMYKKAKFPCSELLIFHIFSLCAAAAQVVVLVWIGSAHMDAQLQHLVCTWSHSNLDLGENDLVTEVSVLQDLCKTKVSDFITYFPLLGCEYAKAFLIFHLKKITKTELIALWQFAKLCSRSCLQETLQNLLNLPWKEVQNNLFKL